MRVKHVVSQSLRTDGEVTGAKTGDLEVPDGRSFLLQGKGRSRFEFDRDLDAVDFNRPCRIRGIEFQLAL